ncbi:retrovirus-related pol polyprotein from transposon TNT 1-94 [Tanacetum coccineum]
MIRRMRLTDPLLEESTVGFSADNVRPERRKNYKTQQYAEIYNAGRVWKLVDTSYRAMWDKAYWGFLRVRTTVDIFKNLRTDTPYLFYGYGVLVMLFDVIISSQQDFDNLFGPLYEEYYAPSTSKVSNNSAVNTLDVEDTPLPSSIIVEDSDALQIDSSNMHEFHQQRRYADKWTKNHPIEQVIVSLIEPKNIKEAMLDHSRIESMQDELNQFKRLDVWELVPLPKGRITIKVKWVWKNKTDAENMVIQNKSYLVAKGYSQ